MGLAIDYFYALEPRQFQNIIEGYTRKKEREVKERWRQVQWICFWSAAPLSKSIKKPDDVLQLPWDEILDDSNPIDQSPEEQMKAIKAKWEEIDKKRLSGQSDS